MGADTRGGETADVIVVRRRATTAWSPRSSSPGRASACTCSRRRTSSAARRAPSGRSPTRPRLGTSTGAYLLGLMPPELLATLGLDLPLMRRDPHYFLPTTGDRYLLFGSDQAAMQRAVPGVLLRGRLARQRGAAGRDRPAARRRRAHLAAGAAVDRGRPPSATSGRRCARRSSTCAAARSATTSTASASRATC